MIPRRYFSVIRVASRDGSFVAARDDGIGRVFISEREAALVGSLEVGDRVEVSIMPGGVATEVLLVRRARRLEAAK